MNLSRLNRFLAVSLAGLMLFVSAGMAAPQPAYALGIPGLPKIVLDPFNLVKTAVSAVVAHAQLTKEFVLDPAAWVVSKLAVQSITKSTVNWINSGFDGSPAFVTNISQSVLKVNDTTANNFISQLTSQGQADSSLWTDIAPILNSQYYKSTGANGFFNANPYTLNQYTSDAQAFRGGDFSKGGLNAWWASLQDANNPYGAYLLAQDQLDKQQQSASSNWKQEVDWGNGIGSFKGNCATPAKGSTVSLSLTDPCLLTGIIKTPSSVINASLQKVLGSSVDSLVQSDEIGEIIGNLVGGLISNTLSGGLSSLSQPSSSGSGSGPSYTSQLDNSQYSSATNSIVANFTQTLAGEVNDVKAYQANWQKVDTAAQTAKTACANDQTKAAGIQTVIDQQTTPALAKAAVALTKLNAIASSTSAASAPTTDQVTQVTGSLDSYNALVSSRPPILPQPDEIAQAETNAEDTGDDPAPSLYTQLVQDTSACSGKK